MSETRSPARRLARDPRRFTFDAAIRILTFARRRADPADAAQLVSSAGLDYPAAEVTGIDAPGGGRPPVVTVALFGLTGPSGVLPRHYTESVSAGLRNRSRSLHDFLQVISQAMTAFFAAAGTKYRPHRAADTATLAAGQDRAPHSEGGPVGEALLSLTGYATPHMTDRLLTGAAPLQHYAGLFAARPRSADRLAALASDWLGRPVAVEQFVGGWLSIPPDGRTRLQVGLKPGQFTTLGGDAAIGVRAWDQQARIVLRVGPLDLASFEALLPDRPGLCEFSALVRAFVGWEVSFAINPVLARSAVPPLALGATGARLGWNSWVPVVGTRRRTDAADATFDATLIEGLAA